MGKRELLRAISFGQRIAEEETQELASYFVETDQWRRIVNGDVDVVYGPKGSGKSAIYSVLLENQAELFNRNILIISGENPRGAPAFKDLVNDPPTSEAEFRALWKLYFLGLTGTVFREYSISNDPARSFLKTVEAAGLLPKSRDLSTLIRSALDYARSLVKLESFEAGVQVDPMTGLPAAMTGKITIRQPSEKARELGFISADSLFSIANQALELEDFQLWIILDRLDVAFADSAALEENALRALFKVYIDLFGMDRIHPKIFLRTDIWERITQAGFREASHITRHVTITWTRQSLMNLVVRRILKNRPLVDYYGVDSAAVLADSTKQESFFYRAFPEQVDVGDKKPSTFDWMLSRTRDGLAHTAPRELIHLLSSSREVQLRRLEVGEPDPSAEILIDRLALKEALQPVSKVRLEQTIFAEYPQFRTMLLKLKGEKTQQSQRTLAEIWGLSEAAALDAAYALAEVGFFEVRGTKDHPEFWVPFLYRDALDLVQGQAAIDDTLSLPRFTSNAENKNAD